MSSFLKFYNENGISDTSLEVGIDEGSFSFEIHSIDTDMYFSVVLSDQEVDELIKFLQHKKEIMEIGNE